MAFDGDWQLGLTDIGALRLQQARRAWDARDPGRAMVEAEELLDEEPDNLDALLLVADAALELGDTAVARAAFGQALEIDNSIPTAWSGYAVASYELTDLPACVDAARHALAMDEGIAEAHFYLGLALDHQGDEEQAAAELGRATQLDPASFPAIPRLDPVTAEHALARALSLMAPPMRAWFDQVPIVFDRYPSIEQLRQEDLPLSPSSPALYVGKPPTEGQDPTQSWPERFVVYVRNLERMAALGADVGLILATALRGEALDWFGLPDDEMPLRV